MYLNSYGELPCKIIKTGYYSNIDDLIIDIVDSQFTKLYLNTKVKGIKTINIKNCKTANYNNEFIFNDKLLECVNYIYVDDILVYVNKEKELDEKLDLLLDKLSKFEESKKIKIN